MNLAAEFLAEDGGNLMPRLGQTELEVSPLCFGTLALSPLQGCSDISQGSKILRYGLEQGINFLDTAEIYNNYELIRMALQGFEREVVIASKSYAFDAGQMDRSLESARKGLDRDVIELFLLHEQESLYTIKGHWEALKYLLKAKQRGIVKAVGISTHAVAGVRAGAALPEIDVIHPIINQRGLGIIDGTLAEMLEAVELARQMGKGLYGMKALGGGHLASQPIEALNFVRGIPGITSVAVGMSTYLEVDFNLRVFAEQQVPLDWLAGIQREERMLYVAPWCSGCGKCLGHCPQGALNLHEGQSRVEHAKCVLCGYCGAACPHFCLKIIRQEILNSAPDS